MLTVWAFPQGWKEWIALLVCRTKFNGAIQRNRCHAELRVSLILESLQYTVKKQNKKQKALPVLPSSVPRREGAGERERKECSQLLALGTENFILRWGIRVGSWLEVFAACDLGDHARHRNRLAKVTDGVWSHWHFAVSELLIAFSSNIACIVIKGGKRQQWASLTYNIVQCQIFIELLWHHSGFSSPTYSVSQCNVRSALLRWWSLRGSQASLSARITALASCSLIW